MDKSPLLYRAIPQLAGVVKRFILVFEKNQHFSTGLDFTIGVGRFKQVRPVASSSS